MLERLLDSLEQEQRVGAARPDPQDAVPTTAASRLSSGAPARLRAAPAARSCRCGPTLSEAEMLRACSPRPVLPRRWVVERSFGWMVRWRRLVRDYEQRCDVSEAMIHVGMGSLLLRRICHP
jgi:transposase